MKSEEFSRIARRVAAILLICTVFLFSPRADAAQTWEQIGEHIRMTLSEAVETYRAGDVDGAKKKVNDAYYAIYEKDGLEMTIRRTISAKDVGLTEYYFNQMKRVMIDGGTPEAAQAEADKVMEIVDKDVALLMHKGTEQGGWASFWAAFLILIREGVEAILVLVAIIAYLARAGRPEYLNTVYNWAIAAVVASFASAYLFSTALDSAASGASREIIEGATALFAVVVLLATSAWMGSKADAAEWKKYIEGMVNTTISTGKMRALGLAAFLAVYREGAEVILFYQALFNNAFGDVDMIWLGFAAGCAVLAILFFLIQHGALRIPLRPFFLVTSALMFLLAVTFTGSGIEELQEGEVISMTRIEGFPTIDVLGIYPTYETLIPQVILIAIAVVMVLYKKRQSTGGMTA